VSRCTYIIGDTRDVTATLPDGSVDLVLTSPPFLALRSYLPADHPDKHREIGSEPDPAGFLDTLLALTAEWRRVLAPHGTIAVELGDTYSGSTAGGGDFKPDGEPTKYRRGDLTTAAQIRRTGDSWPLAKSLALIPELYRIALAYGINPLTGQPSPAGRWRVRNVVRWVRPNPPVGALGDKFRPATSDMVIACTSSTRWFDLDAVREPLAAKTLTVSEGIPPSAKNLDSPTGSHKMDRHLNPAGAPPLDWWNIPPGGYSGSHYAVFPPELCVRPIKAMCPAEVCRQCGEPRRRVVEKTPEYAEFRARANAGDQRTTEWDLASGNRAQGLGGSEPGDSPARGDKYVTLGWTDCGHGDYRPGIVLDPFGGSGTTGMVATGHGRDAILIDLDERNADLARERIGMFLDVRHHQGGAA
jgi:DNA modification methylase